MVINPGAVNQVAMFIDYEYLYYGVVDKYHCFPNPDQLITICKQYGQISHAKAFGDYNNPQLGSEASRLRTSSIEAVNASSQTLNRPKDYTDFVMLDDIYQTLLEKPEIGTYILVTGDGHFSGVAARLRVRFNKKVIVIGLPGSISNDLRASASHVEEINIKAPEVPTKEEVIRFIAQGEAKYNAIAFRSTAEAFSRATSTPFPTVKMVMSEMVAEGLISQEEVNHEGRQARIIHLNHDNPQVMKLLESARIS